MRRKVLRKVLRPDTAGCRCGHPYAAHQHLRRGSDCSMCPGTCPRFRLRLGSVLFPGRRSDDGDDAAT